jgi:hypothetical protein
VVYFEDEGEGRENGGMVVMITMMIMMMTTTTTMIKEPFIFMLEVEARSSSL